MKKINLILFVSTLFLISCHKESELAIELSESDDIATEGMEEAEHEAREYNDSLIWCADTNHNCTVSDINHYDSLFHHYNDLYDFHHSNYSHNNIDDDHHHSAASNHHHGTVDHGDEDDEEHHGHSIEGHQEMVELRDNHKNYHPN